MKFDEIVPDFKDDIFRMKIMDKAPKLYDYMLYDASTSFHADQLWNALKALKWDEDKLISMIKRQTAKEMGAIYGPSHPSFKNYNPIKESKENPFLEGQKWEERGHWLVLGGKTDQAVRTKPSPNGKYMWQFRKKIGYSDTVEEAMNEVEAATEFSLTMGRSPH